MARYKSFATQLRQAVREAKRRGMSLPEIADKAGVSLATLSLFMNFPDRTMQIQIADKVARAIGMHMTLVPRRKKR